MEATKRERRQQRETGRLFSHLKEMVVSSLLILVNAPLAPASKRGMVDAIKPRRGVSESNVGNTRFFARLTSSHQTKSHEEPLLV